MTRETIDRGVQNFPKKFSLKICINKIWNVKYVKSSSSYTPVDWFSGHRSSSGSPKSIKKRFSDFFLRRFPVLRFPEHP